MLLNGGLFSLVYFIAIQFLVQHNPDVTVAPIESVSIEGQTMGTSYHITYFDVGGRNFKTAIDSLLSAVNKSISTYDVGSVVSAFNHSSNGIALKSFHFSEAVKKSYSIARASYGAFDPTVMPLVNAWGFGPGKFLSPMKQQIDSIKVFVGIEKLCFKNDSIKKGDPRIQLDFGGIGQGYAADVVSQFLESKGIANSLVEIGGEGMALGKNLTKNKSWQIGILDPNSTRENQFFKAYVRVENRSFTTSGNYFNYREVKGKKVGHTIDPQSGYPVSHELLSASVFAIDGATADAWATAFMVVGLERAKALLREHPSLDALFIYSLPGGKTGTYSTDGLKNKIIIEQ